jgi:hypothetical protein
MLHVGIPLTASVVASHWQNTSGIPATRASLALRALRFSRDEITHTSISSPKHTCRGTLLSAESMLPISRRDRQAVEQLLPLLHREITADPEQHNPLRREARRRDIANAKILFNEERRAQEARKDSELRAKLDGKSQLLLH